MSNQSSSMELLNAGIIARVQTNPAGFVIHFRDGTSPNTVRDSVVALKYLLQDQQHEARLKGKEIEIVKFRDFDLVDGVRVWKHRCIDVRVVSVKEKHIKQQPHLVQPTFDGDKPTRFTARMLQQLREAGMGLKDIHPNRIPVK